MANHCYGNYLKCCIRGCSSDDSTSKVTFFKIPTASLFRNFWLKNINMREEDVKSRTRICEKHFIKNNDFANDRRLLKGAVPTLNLPCPPVYKSCLYTRNSDPNSNNSDRSLSPPDSLSFTIRGLSQCTKSKIAAAATTHFHLNIVNGKKEGDDDIVITECGTQSDSAAHVETEDMRYIIDDVEFDTATVNSLKSNTSEMSVAERRCALVLSEEEMGNGKCILLFTVQGIVKKYEQLISYTVMRRNTHMHEEDLGKDLMEHIKRALELGFTIDCIITSEKKSFIKAFNILGFDMRARKNLICIKVNGTIHEIYIIFNCVRLIDNIYGIFLKHSLLLPYDGGIISYDVIKKMLEKAEDDQLDGSMFQHLLASGDQTSHLVSPLKLFSALTVDCIQMYIDLDLFEDGLEQQSAQSTQNFIQLICEILNQLNSCIERVNMIEFLNKMYTFIGHIQTIKCESNRRCCFQSLVITLQSTIELLIRIFDAHANVNAIDLKTIHIIKNKTIDKLEKTIS